VTRRKAERNPLPAVLAAQFLSAFSDNALLVDAIALLKAGHAEAHAPLLQVIFALPFILLAPFAGAMADAMPKSRAMMLSNALKFSGAALMLMGLAPIPCFAVVGIGAAAYSPAKYGILPELFENNRLVEANGWMEGATIFAIILGAVAGGLVADHSLRMGILLALSAYGMAALVNLAIPALPPPRQGISFGNSLPRFFSAFRRLLRDGDARFTLAGTSLFWGTGATLRIALFAWVPAALSLFDNRTPGVLIGVVAIGIVFGALAASLWAKRAKDALIPGIAIGPLIAILSHVHSESIAMLLLAAIGFCGGAYVVPLNALLQARGHELTGSGSALAVQNFFENLAIFFMLGIYAGIEKTGVPEKLSVACFGLSIFVGMVILTGLRRGPWKT
jgi:LPLT family lysophospholipid transporter-like MFS transporter